MKLKLNRYFIVDWVYSSSTKSVFAVAFLTYIVLALSFGLIYYVVQGLIGCEVVTTKQGPVNWWDYFYFSFVTQTTVGDANYSAIRLGKVLVPLQAVLGVFFIALVIPLVIVKLWAPKDSIIFAKQAELSYQIMDQETAGRQFAFRCINTHKMDLNDVKAICYFKRIDPKHSTWGYLNQQLEVSPDELPYMGQSVWLFHTDRVALRAGLVTGNQSVAPGLRKLIDESDSYKFKVLIVGMYGTSPFSAVHVYEQRDLVDGKYAEIPDEPDKTESFYKNFHRVAGRD